jgi:ATP-dependent helicase Lhr and Lhr-like helicase
MSHSPAKPAAFTRLHLAVQEALYRMKWTELRPIQVDAINDLFDGKGDLVISARTAAGKTEAAFLPIVSRIVAEPRGSVQAIYVGPLKALINDQFRRLEELCAIAEVPVHKWHGDVGPAAKKRLRESPAGILLITPESIESLFVNHPDRLATVFARLAFVVIDEMHSFLGTERGAHLNSLISRLAAKSDEPVRRLGLSATLGDMDSARRWLRPRDPESVHLIHDTSDEKVVRLKLYGYADCPARRSDSDESTNDKLELPASQNLTRDVFTAFHGRTALIFANSKSDIELYADCASREASERGLPDTFRVHHGSLSKGEREDTEDSLRSGRPTATFCSSTLEMGIDIGNIQAIGQIGPAWTVASMLQRLGRSGRKDGEPQEMRIYVEEEEPDANTALVDRLFPHLLQAIAMTELMIVEKWCEPPEVNRLHLSTLVQQVLSMIAESGGVMAERLYAVLVERGAFTGVDKRIFLQTLRDIGTADLIEQTPEGLLILGLKGEQIVAHHDFYLAFQVDEQYRVTHRGRHIGDVGLPPLLKENPFIILAGRRWKVLDIDDSRRSILVDPSPGGRRPLFQPSHSGEIHARVRGMMQALLFRDDVPMYLDTGARQMLAQARASAREAELDRCPFIQDGSDVTWFTWTGTRIQHTLSGLGTHLGGFRLEDRGIALSFEKATTDAVFGGFRRLLDAWPDPQTLASRFECRAREKYEPFLSGPLTTHVFARERLDLDGAQRVILDSLNRTK